MSKELLTKAFLLNLLLQRLPLCHPDVPRPLNWPLTLQMSLMEFVLRQTKEEELHSRRACC